MEFRDAFYGVQGQQGFKAWCMEMGCYDTNGTGWERGIFCGRRQVLTWSGGYSRVVYTIWYDTVAPGDGIFSSLVPPCCAIYTALL